LELRPFESVDDLNTKLQQGKKKAGPAGISSRMFSECVNVFSGYGAVDDVLADCERIGAQLRKIIVSWTSSTSDDRDENDGAISLIAISAPTNNASKDCLVKQPSLLSQNIQLKDYQLSGVSWLRLLYRKQLSCILADEMGKLTSLRVMSVTY
jgi:SWI/SNF-related matrix-associated actin-dependent regulator 1 of chromatin subfamily A